MPVPLTTDVAKNRLLATHFWSEDDVFWHWRRYQWGAICNSKFKPCDGEADKPGRSQLDLESSRELVGRLKEEDRISGTI